MTPEQRRADAKRLLSHHRQQADVHRDNLKAAQARARQAQMDDDAAQAALAEAQAAHDEAHEVEKPAAVDAPPKRGRKPAPRMPKLD